MEPSLLVGLEIAPHVEEGDAGGGRAQAEWLAADRRRDRQPLGELVAEQDLNAGSGRPARTGEELPLPLGQWQRAGERADPARVELHCEAHVTPLVPEREGRSLAAPPAPDHELILARGRLKGALERQYPRGRPRGVIDDRSKRPDDDSEVAMLPRFDRDLAGADSLQHFGNGLVQSQPSPILLADQIDVPDDALAPDPGPVGPVGDIGLAEEIVDGDLGRKGASLAGAVYIDLVAEARSSGPGPDIQRQRRSHEPPDVAGEPEDGRVQDARGDNRGTLLDPHLEPSVPRSRLDVRSAERAVNGSDGVKRGRLHLPALPFDAAGPQDGADRPGSPQAAVGAPTATAPARRSQPPRIERRDEARPVE